MVGITEYLVGYGGRGEEVLDTQWDMERKKGYGEEEGRKYWILSGIWRKRGGSTGYLVGHGEEETTEYLVGYGEEEGRKYWILSGIWRGRGEEILDT